MEQEYIRIKPSREALNPDELVRNLASLHKINGEPTNSGGLFSSSEPTPPAFEFLAISQGNDEPVEFYLGCESKYLDTLETALETAYPNSFDIGRQHIDVEELLIPPVRYNDTDEYLDEFGDRIENWDAVSIGEPVAADTVVSPENKELRVADDTSLALPGNPEVVSNADGDGILARPSLDDVTPVGVEWRGEGDRKRDWMTTMKRFTALMDPDGDDIENRHPLARLIQEIAKMELPTVFQVTFSRKKNWEKEADKRRRDLHLHRDTRKQKVMYEVGEIIHPSNQETRREKRRNHLDEEGESSKQEDSADVGDMAPRKGLIDDKHPKRTFNVNIRAACVANRRVTVEEAKDEMNRLQFTLDNLDGNFYGLTSELLLDTSGRFREKPYATELVEAMIDREVLIDGKGNPRREIIMNADELANFIIVPSSRGLTVEGTRETRAKPESRNPLPRPDPDMMNEFHNPGMRIGYALDEDSAPDEEPTQIPPSLLKTHYGRFATTGAGKSKALQNDMLSLYENTDGPTILIDPKGDGMAENYTRAHWKRYGNTEDVYYFPVPDILPAFSFFNINPSLDDDIRRVDAIQNNADHYEEILKLVMGAEKYRESKVAPNLIKSMIKALFDEEHGIHNGRDRDSSNYFSHHDLEHTAMQLRAAASDDEEGHLPEVTDERIHETLTRHLLSNESDFSVIMDAVFNRMDYIKQDAHLRRIFDNTQPKFDFRHLLDDDAVILFDLGDLRDDAALIMTGLILTNLWDALKQSKRENWAPNHVVNCIIDEAASVAVSDLMNNMLEKGRGFNLSVGLAMQFPEQMRAISETAYMNVLNNVGSLMIGKIPLDREVAEAMAHEDMDPEDFRNRFKSLPRGEWIAQLPSPNFKETGPEPFSLDPMPIPAGHDESKTPLTQPEQKAFSEAVLPDVLHRTREQFGVGEMNKDGTSGPQSPSSEGSGDHDADSPDNEDEPTEGVIAESFTDEIADSFGKPSTSSSQETSDTGSDSETPTGPPQMPGSTAEETTPSDGENDTDNSTNDAQSNAAVVEDVLNENTDSSTESHPEPPAEARSSSSDSAGDDGGETGNSYNKDLPFGGTQPDGGGSSEHSKPITTGSLEDPAPKTTVTKAVDDTESNAPVETASDSDSGVPAPENKQQETAESMIDSWSEPSIDDAAFTIATSDRGTDHKLQLLSALAARARVHGFDVELQQNFSDLVSDYIFGNKTPPAAEHENSASSTPPDPPSTPPSSPEISFERSHPIDSKSDLNSFDLTTEERSFLLTLIDTINEKNDYPLLASMTHLKNEFSDVDLERLERDEFIKSHHLVKRGIWFTPLTNAQKAVGESRKTGRFYGDTGEDTPHKVAVEVTRLYLERNREDIARAEKYYPINTDELADVVGFNENGEIVVIAEIEMGGKSRSGRVGTRNRASVTKDYDQMAGVDAEVWWVLENSRTADTILKHLIDGGKLPLENISKGPISGKRKQLKSLNTDLPGLDEMYTLTEVWNALENETVLPSL